MPKVQQPPPRPSFLTPDPCQLPGHEGTFWARGEGPTIGDCMGSNPGATAGQLSEFGKGLARGQAWRL